MCAPGTGHPARSRATPRPRCSSTAGSRTRACRSTPASSSDATSRRGWRRCSSAGSRLVQPRDADALRRVRGDRACTQGALTPLARRSDLALGERTATGRGGDLRRHLPRVARYGIESSPDTMTPAFSTSCCPSSTSVRAPNHRASIDRAATVGTSRGTGAAGEVLLVERVGARGQTRRARELQRSLCAHRLCPEAVGG